MAGQHARWRVGTSASSAVDEALFRFVREHVATSSVSRVRLLSRRYQIISYQHLASSGAGPLGIAAAPGPRVEAEDQRRWRSQNQLSARPQASSIHSSAPIH